MSDSTTTWSLDMPPIESAVVGRWVLFYEEVASTQSLVLERPLDGLVVVADGQITGRGCRGNTWHSPRGKGLWLSACVEGSAQGLNLAAGLAAYEALRVRAPVTLKWPNDLLCQGRKICGVLVEHRNGWNAIGIGLNVHQCPEDFPEALRATAGSLDQLAPGEWDRAQLLAAILKELDYYVQRLRDGGYETLLREWVRACDIVGRTIEREGLRGVVVGIDGDGALLVDTEDGRKRLLSGTIRCLDGEDDHAPRD
ncbi:MAG: biotin--[acetyl-CoA-carboxylase] ligase [Candidatus Hydrogenedentes bacterium]|nr:biotin--[acetyl-CoA-carboxylase] ligase [Candidatus Hydrogenedentota bacterium]